MLNDRPAPTFYDSSTSPKPAGNSRFQKVEPVSDWAVAVSVSTHLERDAT